MAKIISGGRLRKSPFYAATVAEGAESFLTYNNMLIPRGYGDHEAEYWRLLTGVSMWDVAAQRQVELFGPDAARLAQTLCARDLSQQSVGQGKYAAICDHQGRLLNDPIVTKLSEDRYWLSISNSDIWTWARAVAGERGFDVEVSEPDASPLAIQGPKAEDVVASLFGEWVREIRYFWLRDATLNGIPLRLARSGWSKQGGFELYLLDQSKGTALWQMVKEAGAPFDIGPGYPNPSERTESGLLNLDVDIDAATNPFEVRMGRFVDTDLENASIGNAALHRILSEGVQRHQCGVILDGDFELEDQSIRLPVSKNGAIVGEMTHKAWSYRLKKMIGYALVSKTVSVGDHVQVNDGRARSAQLVALPFNIDA